MELDIKLTVDEAQMILNILAEAPFKIAEPLITKIRNQAQVQVAAAQQDAMPKVEAPAVN